MKYPGLFPQVSKRGLAQVTGSHWHVRTWCHIPLWGDATVVFPGWARAVRVILEERRGRIELPDNTAKVRGAFGPDEQAPGGADGHAPRIFLPGEDRFGTGRAAANPLP